MWRATTTSRAGKPSTAPWIISSLRIPRSTRIAVRCPFLPRDFIGSFSHVMSEDGNIPAVDRAPVDDGVPVVSHPGSMSLEGMHGSVDVPEHQAGFWKQW